MPQLEFYNLNEHRKYPFVFPASGKLLLDDPMLNLSIPDDVFLDCGFTLGAVSGYRPDQHQVILEYVKKTGTTLEFSFQATSMTPRFVFTRENSDPWGSTDYYMAGSPDYGVGFLATGHLQALAALLSEGTHPVWPGTPPIVVEPALIVSQRGHYVKTINVGNLKKISGSNCCDPVTPFDDQIVDLVAIGLTGKVSFKAGYNMSLYVDKGQGILILTPVIGSGMGEPCTRAIPTPGDAVDCKDLIFTINGVEAAESGAFTLTASNGLYIDLYPSEHKIVIRGELAKQIICEE
jgi:hypothetical protein